MEEFCLVDIKVSTGTHQVWEQLSITTTLSLISTELQQDHTSQDDIMEIMWLSLVWPDCFFFVTALID